MSSLARYFMEKDIAVSGYDQTETILTQSLIEEGANIHYEDNVDKIKDLEQIDLVVYTPAIPFSHSELTFFMNSEIKVLKRAELLGWITKDSFSIAVAGTHGKTTTSSIIAHMLEVSGVGCNAFLGGISTNYNSNFILNKQSNKTVVEADEYDRSFLNLSPNISILTSMDSDHLDIYGDENELTKSFQEFVDLLPEDGKLICYNGLNVKSKNIITYGENDNSNLKIKNISISEGEYYFDVTYKSKEITGLHLGISGKHNVYNAAAAIVLALELGINDTDIKKSLASFKGVKRRFEYHIKEKSLVYIDDYAHHPKEIDAFIGSVRELYPTKKITGVFQPHLFTRTRDFLAEFALSLSALDEIILLDIYPARELPIKGVSSLVLLKKINCPNKKLIDRKELVSELENRYLEVLVTLGAGNIDELVSPIKNILKTKIIAN